MVTSQENIQNDIQITEEIIEDYNDAKDAEEAYKKFLADPETVSHDDFWDGLV